MSTSRVKVKICGLSRKQDVDFVNQLLPDYAGFVFAESRRRVSVAEAERMAQDLAPAMKKVGVFVNAPPSFVQDAAVRCNLDILQFHGRETSAYWQSFSKPIWKALRIRDQSALIQASDFNGIEALLLDSERGGSGRTFDWRLVKGLELPYPLILAGGLNPDNVLQAIAAVRPFAVDVSSGVETDGIKDFHKIQLFIEKVRGSYEYSI